MIQLSSITNGISNIAQSAAVQAKNLYVDSKVSAVFRATVGTIQAHPYITLLGAGVTLYCCRGLMGKLVDKVNQAAHVLYTKASISMTNLINFFMRSPVSRETPTNGSDPNRIEPPLTSSTTPPVDETNTSSLHVQLDGTDG